MFKLKLFFKNTGASSIIITVLLLIFMIIAANGYFIIHSLNKYTKYDSFIINKLGQIKGNIQRYAIYKTNHNPEFVSNIKNNIEYDFKTLNMIIENFPETIPTEYRIRFIDLLANLYSIWSTIKETNNKDEILKQAQNAWLEANKITNLMQEISEKKIELISAKYYGVIIFTSVSILLLILFVYKVIRIGLERTSITDSLTSLYNRLYFNEQIVFYIEKYNRYKEPFSMMLFDIDNFKKINDTYGHNEGDRVLKEIANIIKNTIRKTDLAFRYGGEEFMIIFPKTQLTSANIIAQRIKAQIENTIKVHDSTITISGAVGEYNDEGIYRFIQKLDNKLYEAKNTGKNKVLIVQKKEKPQEDLISFNT